MSAPRSIDELLSGRRDSLADRISEGGRRLGIVVGGVLAIPGAAAGGFLCYFLAQTIGAELAIPGAVVGALAGSTVAYWAGLGIVRALTWIVRGFVDG